MGLEIVDVGRSCLSESEVRDVARIEACPEVMVWEEDPIGDPDDLERSVKRFEEFFRSLVRDDRTCLLARLDGRMVGFLAIGHKPKPERSVGSVSVMVNPTHQNMGIGTELLRKGVELSRERDFSELEIETLEGNAAMRRIAEKTGFHVSGIAPCKWKEGQRQVTYQLNL